MQKKYTYNDILNILIDYHWMVKEVNRLNLQMQSVETVGVASYSDEPRSTSGTSKRLEAEVMRRERKYDRKKKYEERITLIRDSYHLIEAEQHKVVFDCILDGMSLNGIATHLNINRTTVRKIRNQIIESILSGQKTTQTT